METQGAPTPTSESFKSADTQNLVQIARSKATRYKPSRFNAQSTAEDGTLILYNSLTGHRCGLPPATAPHVKKFLSQVGTEGPLNKLGNYLLQKGYIVESAVDEQARWDIRYGVQQFRTDVLQLILLSSEDCNFRCVYCCQLFKRGTMLPEVRKGVRNLIEQRIEKLRVLHINWFGGEPMLGYDAIEELAPYCQEIAKKHNVFYGSNITTNGYLLTPERSQKMVEWGIKEYQITIDGSVEDHDQHRVLKDGGGTFHEIIDNIAAMKALDSEFTVYVRVNFDHDNMPRLEQLFELLKHRIGGDSRFQMRFRSVGKWGGPNDDGLNVCSDRESHTKLIELTNQARDAGLGSEDLAQSWLDPNQNSVCYAARPFNYVIGSDGKVMKCTLALDTEEANIVGKISSDGNLNLNEDNLAKWVKPYYHSDTMCQKCFYVPVCQGAICPLPRIVNGDRPCPPHKTYIKESLKHIWQDKAVSKLVQISKS